MFLTYMMTSCCPFFDVQTVNYKPNRYIRAGITNISSFFENQVSYQAFMSHTILKFNFYAKLKL